MPSSSLSIVQLAATASRAALPGRRTRSAAPTKTGPVPSAPGAECVTVKDGKITYSRTVFDSGPLVAALQVSS
jgi:hypothetical protein